MTKTIKYKGSYQKNMQEIKVSVREFLRNYKEFSGQNKIVIIKNRGEPEGVFVPFKEWEKSSKKMKLTNKDLDQFIFKGGDPKLSQKIDEIIYGKNNN